MNNVGSALLLLFLSAGLARACKNYCLDESCRIDMQDGPCLDGEVEVCGRTVCAKGPGESCGGIDSWRGKCGRGMHCQSGRCSGCSTTRYLNGAKPEEACRKWDKGDMLSGR
uniref:Neuroparsin-A n=1 Tax=Lygus hesperus TaxID=30085 RepID=A0A146L6E2_LYGHE